MEISASAKLNIVLEFLGKSLFEFQSQSGSHHSDTIHRIDQCMCRTVKDISRHKMKHTITSLLGFPVRQVLQVQPVLRHPQLRLQA